jgi:hypothetical protein
MLRIDDEVTALDFDLTCTARLKIHDEEVENARVEAMALGTMGQAFGRPQPVRPVAMPKHMKEGSF